MLCDLSPQKLQKIIKLHIHYSQKLRFVIEAEIQLVTVTWIYLVKSQIHKARMKLQTKIMKKHPKQY